jgi:hypothetical protein
MKGSSPASFEKKINAKTVCDACQQAKSHQLPYPVPNSISKAPLDLVFLMCGDRPLTLLVEKINMSFY